MSPAGSLTCAREVETAYKTLTVIKTVMRLINFAFVALLSPILGFI